MRPAWCVWEQFMHKQEPWYSSKQEVDICTIFIYTTGIKIPGKRSVYFSALEPWDYLINANNCMYKSIADRRFPCWLHLARLRKKQEVRLIGMILDKSLKSCKQWNAMTFQHYFEKFKDFWPLNSREMFNKIKNLVVSW